MYQRHIKAVLNPVIRPPFGSCISSRGFSSAAYRYGFNGKEKEADGTADNYDFGARIYDGRLGRWYGLDVLKAEYPSLSPFSYSGNNPVCFYDPNGKEIIIHYMENGKNKYISYKPGVEPASTNKFVLQVHEACKYAMNSETGKKLWDDLDKLQKTTTEVGLNGETTTSTKSQVVTIAERDIDLMDLDKNAGGTNMDEFIAGDNQRTDELGKLFEGKEQIGTIHWDPTAELLTDNGAGSYEGHIAPSTALIHEMGHALRYSTDPVGMDTDNIPFEITDQDFNFTNPEEKRNIKDVENKYVQEINEYEKNKAPAGANPIKQSVRGSHGATPIVNKSNGVNSCTQGNN